MKRISFFTAVVFLLFSVILTVSCKKETEKDCKTCKAFSVDGLVGEEEVCSDAEEQDFRSEFAGKEISCQ